MRKSLRFLLGILVVLGIITGGFVLWGSSPAKPMSEALTSLQSDAQVRVTIGNWLVFTPVGSELATGFIIYPGGRVDYRAYAPLAHAIAAQHNLVVIVHMPLNLAVFNPNAAETVIAAHPEIKVWIVGGHSLGGSMAANFAHTHPTQVQGLVLWASYPGGSDDLSQSKLKVLSISGTLDGLSTPAKIKASHSLLPEDTVWVSIVGGDHSQFGWYGPQAGDNLASIKREDQQMQIIQATVAFLDTLK